MATSQLGGMAGFATDSQESIEIIFYLVLKNSDIFISLSLLLIKIIAYLGLFVKICLSGNIN